MSESVKRRRGAHPFIPRAPLENYKKWVNLTAKYYDEKVEDILNCKIRGSELTKARYTFYRLCMLDGIHMGQLSRVLGKNRTTIMGTLSKYKFRKDRNAEQLIIKKSEKY